MGDLLERNDMSPEPSGELDEAMGNNGQSEWLSLFGGAHPTQSHGDTQVDKSPQTYLDVQPHDDAPPPITTNNHMLYREHSVASSHISSVVNNDSYVLPTEDPIKAYGLRKHVNREFGTALYVDDSSDENFDPSAEARQAALRLLQARQKKRARNEKKKKGNKKGMVDKRKKKNVPKFIVRLCIQRFGTVLNITNMEDQWPAGHSDIDTEDELSHGRISSSSDDDPQVPIQDPLGEYEDLTGHPEARGCTGCRKADQPCSMVQNGEWPCETCASNREECVKIYQPNIERIDLDKELYADRDQVQCDCCISRKKQCSLKEKTDKPPCKQCKKGGCTFYGTPRSRGPNSKKKLGSAENSRSATHQLYHVSNNVYIPNASFFNASDLEETDHSDVDSVREPTPEIIMVDQFGNRGPVIEIKTCFAHPIEFYIDDNPQSRFAASNCNFCTSPVFNFVGNYETMVYVLVWPSGKGYTEIGNGHQQQRCSRTIMCVDCSYSRLQIIACPGHRIQPIQSQRPQKRDFYPAIQDLVDTTAESKEQYRTQYQRWCSFCFNLATHGCCEVQESALREGQKLDGCGLRLCDTCEQALRQEFQGNTNAMATAYDQKPKAKAGSNEEPVGLVRADVGFLREEGQLWKHVEDE
ncbi:hypothetical protein DM02DRAFT_666968 [Periconia macrospinosa]|uniref:Zn(2)-C6 fungal-type domain-containing protein n=1 Tax=Periconia macrospinosa TaxID=97972 RepID=A0A2V1EA50_9PLEO|nr:hypothetical protein DM02DRAFT_666968 [Periconia macrospinosa]